MNSERLASCGEKTIRLVRLTAKRPVRAGRGFTLIEVLVVVAIIALLIAILLPSLAQARKQARVVVCKTNLHEWGKIWAMYLHEYRDSFIQMGLDEGDATREKWIVPFRRYGAYTRSDILRCPLATEPRAGTNHGGPFNTYQTTTGEEASYGINAWVYDAPADSTDFQGTPTGLFYWRKSSNARQPTRVPVFADSMWRGGGPFDSGSPQGDPPLSDGYWSGPHADMDHFCINRHDGYINLLFMDWSVRRAGLRELWRLQWHKKFNTAGPWTKAGGCENSDWPLWLQNMPGF